MDIQGVAILLEVRGVIDSKHNSQLISLVLWLENVFFDVIVSQTHKENPTLLVYHVVDVDAPSPT